MASSFDMEIDDTSHFRVVIFGSARIHHDSPFYQQIYALAKMIAEDGMDVVTGGGPGLMEAASSGHQAGHRGKDIHSIGLPIILPRHEDANNHLDLKKEFHQFSERLDTFMTFANCVVVAPGGVGTMLEFFYTWQLIQVHQKNRLPIILLGDQWPELISWIKKWQLHRKLLDAPDLALLYPAKDVEDAMRIIREAHAAFRVGQSLPPPALPVRRVPRSHSHG